VSPLGTVGIVEHERLTLGPDDHARILRGEIELRQDGMGEYEAVGQTEAADRLRAEIEVLRRYERSRDDG
jgi:uncharacterized protein YqeY